MESKSDLLSVVPIFATPFGVLQLPEAQTSNSVVAELLSARAAAARSSNPSGPNPLCYRSPDDLLDWTDEPLRKTGGAILRGIWSFIAAINDFTPAQLSSLTLQARGWFTIVQPNGAVPACSYPLTSWCGIYCVEAPAPCAERRDSGVLRLYEARLGTMFSDATNSVTRVPFTPGHYTWRPVAGQLCIFPACLTHEIGLIRSAGSLLLITVRARFVAPGQEGLSRW